MRNRIIFSVLILILISLYPMASGDISDTQSTPSTASLELPGLAINQSTPSTTSLTNVIENSTFYVNASVTCVIADCGTVTAKIQYNASSPVPDTLVPNVIGSEPFFINESLSSATKICLFLTQDETCDVSWLLNASGDINTVWEIGVLFESNNPSIPDNYTDNSTVEIVPCVVGMTTHYDDIVFGNTQPNSNENAAEGNSDHYYNVTLDTGSCITDFYIKGSDLVNTTVDSSISISNITFSNTTNEYASSFELSETYTVLKLGLQDLENVTTYYWINTPPRPAGSYYGNITIEGVSYGEAP